MGLFSPGSLTGFAHTNVIMDYFGMQAWWFFLVVSFKKSDLINFKFKSSGPFRIL